MTAESLTAALENTPLGETWAEPLANAESVNDASFAAAAAALFPAHLAPTTADALAQYGMLIERIPSAQYGEGMAQLHERALSTHPDLAALLRSHEALLDVSEGAARLAAPAHNLEAHAAAAARAADRARSDYMHAIASHIAAVSGHALSKPAKALLACVDLRKRLAAERARREAHAAAELERAEAERKAAARAVRDKTAARVLEAERKAADAAEIAGVTAAEYRRLRADWFVERLRAAGLRELRVGATGLYNVDDLISNARAMSIQQLESLEAALKPHEVD